MAPFDDDCDDGDIGRIHAGNPRCLCERLRSELLEFLSAFKSHSRAGIIVPPGGNLDGLILLGADSGDFLLAYIPGVMMPDPKLLDDWQYFTYRKKYEAAKMVYDKGSYLIKRLAGVQMFDKRLTVNLVNDQRTVLDFGDG